MRRWIIPAIGAGLLIDFISIAALRNLSGPATHDFLWRYFIAFGFYGLAVILVWRRVLRSLRVIWLFAAAFRAVLLFSPSTLSDDVYRYIWDGRIQNGGINPYAYRVDAPQLDRLATPNRARVDHTWMASPYLPMAQVYFVATYRLAPESVTAFQIGAATFDLLAGLFLVLTLRCIGLPESNAILYLWNPLVIVEVVQGAHVDALMLMLMMASLWAASRPPAGSETSGRLWASAILLALATLVKPIPALLAPILMWRWGWKRTLGYALVIVVGIVLFADAGLGLGRELDGTGVFGATRIYVSQWNFNGGLFHWLEVTLTGVQTPGAVPIDQAGAGGAAARLVVLAALAAAVAALGLKARRARSIHMLLGLTPLLFVAYVLFATTVNPWYLLPLMAVLPLQIDMRHSTADRWLHLAAWLYFSAAVALSYLTYSAPDPAQWGETYDVRTIEYLPLYALLLIALMVWLWLRRLRRG